MCEMSHRTANLIVFVVRLDILDVVAPHYLMISVFEVGFPFEEVDFTEEPERQRNY